MAKLTTELPEPELLPIYAILIWTCVTFMHMQIGLLGKANVGKSTFFSAATETPVATGNFPFTTIEPNVGVSHVRTDCACRHFGVRHENQYCVDGTRFIPVKLIDIAGLVPGAHEGKGLGNQFLDDARQAEALIHIVDIAGATDIQGQPVAPGSHDPLEDVAFVTNEFEQWLRQILDREWDKLSREVEMKTAKLTQAVAGRFSGLGISEGLIQGTVQKLNLVSKKPKEWSEDDLAGFVKELRLRSKPILIAANKADLCTDLSIVKRITGSEVIPCSAESELLLKKAGKAGVVDYVPGAEAFSIKDGSSLGPEQRKALDLVSSVLEKIKTTGVQRALNRAVFGLLKLSVVYPVEDETRLCNKDGQVLPDARLMPPGATARDLAYAVHADIGRGFLFGINCKSRQRIGADYILQDGDVIKITSSMSRG